MKIRRGFVANSSSSSFVIALHRITGRQLKLIKAHSLKGGPDAREWPWSIEVTEDEVRGSTMMDNFDMVEYLRHIGVPDEAITWAEFEAWER